MQLTSGPHGKTTVAALLAAEKKHDLLLFMVIFMTVFLATPLLVLGGATIGFTYLLGIMVALAVAALVVKKPIIGLYVITGCVVLVEQEPITTHILTDQLNIFYWPASLQGLPDRPIGFLLLFVLLVCIAHRLMFRQSFRGGALFLPFLCFMLCVAMGVIHGLTSGGSLQVVVLEVRPFWYLFGSYLLACNFISQKRHVRALIWMIIVGAGVKGAQGVYIYLIAYHGNLTGHHEIMAHEESFFFIAVMVLLVIFFLHHRYRPQFILLLLIMPLVLLALVANQRRADYLALVVGIVVAWALVYVIKPHMRKQLAIGMLIAAVLGGGYVLAFSHASGTFASPARGVVSVFSPASTDINSIDSNLYRDDENYDLLYTLRQSPLIGWGFGKQFLQPIILPNIITGDPYYLYVPHNSIYWVWMRLGVIGYLAFWYLLGAAIVRGILIVRQLRDAYLQSIAIFVISAIVMEVIVAYADYQLFFYRNVLYLGLLLGLLMRLPVIEGDEEKEQSTNETVDSVRSIATAARGR